LLRSLRSQIWQQGGDRAASPGSDVHLCRRAARVGGAGVDVARRRAGAANVLVRPCSPLRGRTAPRSRPRSADRHPGARSCRGCRHVRRDRSDRREDGVHPDLFGLHPDAVASRVDRRATRRACGRRRSGRDGWAERSGRSRGALCVLRRPGHERRPGLRRSPVAASGAVRSDSGHGSGRNYGGRRGSTAGAVSLRCAGAGPAACRARGARVWDGHAAGRWHSPGRVG
jgi:hypothetical protein